MGFPQPQIQAAKPPLPDTILLKGPAAGLLTPPEVLGLHMLQSGGHPEALQQMTVIGEAQPLLICPPELGTVSAAHSLGSTASGASSQLPLCLSSGSQDSFTIACSSQIMATSSPHLVSLHLAYKNQGKSPPHLKALELQVLKKALAPPQTAS